jgi:hypothetical protein
MNGETKASKQKGYVSHEMMRPGMTKSDLDDVIAAFHKVYENRSEII